MARHTTRGRTEKRQPTAGSFRPGPDPRRHRFTESDCRLGYWVTMLGLTEKTKDPAIREWVRRKVSIHFREKERRRQQDENGTGAGDTGTPEDLPF